MLEEIAKWGRHLAKSKGKMVSKISKKGKK
jgi:hypothetical protein